MRKRKEKRDVRSPPILSSRLFSLSHSHCFFSLSRPVARSLSLRPETEGGIPKLEAALLYRPPNENSNFAPVSGHSPERQSSEANPRVSRCAIVRAPRYIFSVPAFCLSSTSSAHFQIPSKSLLPIYNRSPSLLLLFVIPRHFFRPLLRSLSSFPTRFLLSIPYFIRECTRMCLGLVRRGEEKICSPGNSARRHDSLVYFRFTTDRSFLIYETTGRAGLVGSSHPLFRRIKRSAKFLLDSRHRYLLELRLAFDSMIVGHRASVSLFLPVRPGQLPTSSFKKRKKRRRNE